ncbi:MAG: sensor histidine kinase, partial [Bacteroides sp.]
SKLGQTQKAGEYIPQANKWRRIMNLQAYDKFYFEALCDYYSALKQFDKAVAYGDSVQKVIVRNGLQADDMILHLERQGDLYYTMGNYDKALPLYQRSKALRDSVNHVIADRQMEEIKEMYAMDRLALEEAKMRQRVQWAVIGIVALIILVFIILWLRNYQFNKQLTLSTEATSRAAQIKQEANEQKRRFLSTMSHAIRVPLHSVVGFSQLLSTDTTLTDEERSEYGEIVRYNTEQLMFLVNSVLDLSRLEAGMTKWQLADYDLFQLLRDAAGSVRMNYPQITVDLQLSEEEWIIHTDTGRLMQVFISMIAGTVTTPHPAPETVIVEMRRAGDELELAIEGSPLADRSRENQESILRHQINRLTLEHFDGSYDTDFDHRVISVIFSKPNPPLTESHIKT